MGGAQTFASLCIKIFAERYVVPPMRVALEFSDISEYCASSVRSPGKYRNQLVCKIPRHLADGNLVPVQILNMERISVRFIKFT